MYAVAFFSKAWTSLAPTQAKRKDKRKQRSDYFTVKTGVDASASTRILFLLLALHACVRFASCENETLHKQKELYCVWLIGLIHDSRHIGFQIVMQISHVLCWGANIRKKANCGKSALRNIEITLLKVHFRI